MIYVQQFCFVLCKFCPDWKSGIFATFSFVFNQSNWNNILSRFCPNQRPGIWPSSKHLPMYSPEVPELSLILLSTNLELPDGDGFYEILKQFLTWFYTNDLPNQLKPNSKKESIHLSKYFKAALIRSFSVLQMFPLTNLFLPLQIRGMGCPPSGTSSGGHPTSTKKPKCPKNLML